MKKKLAGLLLLVMLTGVTACGTVDRGDSQSSIQDIESTKDGDASDETPDVEGSEPENSDGEDAEPESNVPEYAGVGQMVTGDRWSIALLYAKEYDSIVSDYYSDEPSEGNKFLVLFFDVKNVSSENDYFNSMYFEGYADDYSVNNKVVFGSPDGMRTIGGDLDAGKMSRGNLVYEVPADWSSFEISYRDGVWTSHKAATFVINKEDISPADYTYADSVFPEYTLDDSKKTEIGTEISNDEWTVKLVDAKKYSAIGDTYVQTPDEGKEFVLFFIEAENISSEDDYFNTLYFRFYVDGYLESQTVLLSDVEGYDSIGGDVAAGKKIKGFIAVQAPIGWKSVELIYDDGAFVENKVAEFAIVNE